MLDFGHWPPVWLFFFVRVVLLAGCLFVASSTGLDLESPRRHTSSNVCEGIPGSPEKGRPTLNVGSTIQ